MTRDLRLLPLWRKLLMKLNSTVTFTLGLLLLMLGAGLASGFSGFAIGRDALKGITQPDSRPQKMRSKASSSSEGSESRDGMVLMNEADIIKSMEERIASSAKGGGRSDQEDTAKPVANQEATPTASPTAKFPLSSKVENVTLEVTASRREGNAKLLDLAIKNNGQKRIEFRYTFLTVTDNQGRIVTAETIGLSTEIPNNGETFSGSVKLLNDSLQNAQTVTLELSDYPDQKLLFRLTDIPVQ